MFLSAILQQLVLSAAETLATIDRVISPVYWKVSYPHIQRTTLDLDKEFMNNSHQMIRLCGS